MLKKLLLGISGLVALAILGVTGLLYIQAQRPPSRSAAYVALGSSFAAGVGLGPRAPDSPIVCMRSANGYPPLLARKLRLTLTDMSCSGSTTVHVLKGGQMFLGPQIDAVGPSTRLVTITSGGNDVGYIGDLMGGTHDANMLLRWLAGTPKPIAERDFAGVTRNLIAIVAEIRRRAPRARVVIVSYPAVLPPRGRCAALGIDAGLADLSRGVAGRLEAATRLAASRSGALFVAMGALSAGHDACAPKPWVNGAAPKTGTAFHPSQAGAEAVADSVKRAYLQRHSV